MEPVMLANAALAIGAMTAIWAASVRLRDASIVDVFWGPGFAAIAWTSLAVAGPSPRGLLLSALSTVWGLRLGAYLARRQRGKGEDRRYTAMRSAHGKRFAVVSFFTVFLLQAALMWIVSLPLQAGAGLGRTSPLGLLDAVGALVGHGLVDSTLTGSTTVNGAGERSTSKRPGTASSAASPATMASSETPRAAAMGSKMVMTSRAPAWVADSLTARFSTSVMPLGIATTTRGETTLELLCTFLMK
jgi:hypothetical protein